MNQECQTCNLNCQTCISSATNCTSCPGTNVLYNNQCYSQCPSNYYETTINGNVLSCAACNLNCSSCHGNSNNCTSCINNKILFNNTCIDNCPTHFTLVNSVCVACNSSCGNCLNNANYCTSCDSSLFLEQSSGNCLQNCNPGTFPLNQICQECNSNCLTCINTATNCLSCPTSYLLYNNVCYSKCPQNTYQSSTRENQIICVDCDPSCSSCEGDSNNCTSCPEKKILFNHSCIGNCSAQFIWLNSTCIPCNSSCKACIKNPNYCVSCSDQSLFLDSKSGFCIRKNTCSESEFYDPMSNECPSCYPSCLTCNGPSFNNCTSCKEERIFSNNSCICKNNTFDGITSCGGY